MMVVTLYEVAIIAGRIDPNKIYKAEELEQLLKGHISLDELRHYGRLGFPGGGYWGAAVVDAVNA